MSAASLPLYGASSPRERISAAVCLGAAVALHLAVLALLPAGNRPEAAPLPPVRVTLVSSPAAADAPAPSAVPKEAPAPGARAFARPPASEAAAKRAPARQPVTPEVRREPRPAERAPAPAAPAPAAPPIATPGIEAEALPEQTPRAPSVAPGDAAASQEGAPSAKASPNEAPGRDTVVTARETLVPPSFDAAYLHNPKPEYPRLARRLGEQGTVVLSVYVGADGSPQRIELKTSSGSPRLDQAARETVARWKFVPAQQGGRPVGAWIAVPIRFVLEG